MELNLLIPSGTKTPNGKETPNTNQAPNPVVFPPGMDFPTSFPRQQPGKEGEEGAGGPGKMEKLVGDNWDQIGMRGTAGSAPVHANPLAPCRESPAPGN